MTSCHVFQVQGLIALVLYQKYVTIAVAPRQTIRASQSSIAIPLFTGPLWKHCSTESQGCTARCKKENGPIVMRHPGYDTHTKL